MSDIHEDTAQSVEMWDLQRMRCIQHYKPHNTEHAVALEARESCAFTCGDCVGVKIPITHLCIDCDLVIKAPAAPLVEQFPHQSGLTNSRVILFVRGAGGLKLT